MCGPFLWEKAIDGDQVIFRRDIEGLRGLAVLLVVLAHAGVAQLPGGFVGVDVFFVISGYLITGLLAGQLKQDGRIDLWVFYGRRVRRLLPAFALMVTVSGLAAIWLLPASAWGLQADSGRWAALWSSNIYFASAEFDYFSPGASASLFLHTWSLGVEEQFYLVWPWLLWGAWRWRGRTGLAIACWTVAIGGYLLGMAATQVASWQAYYQTPFRLWQLAAGGAMCLTFGAIRLRSGPSRAARMVGVLMLLVAAVLFAPDRIVYPGAWAAVPVVGTALLLLQGDRGASFTWLEHPSVRFLGRISYSWYLWHWPLLVLFASCFGKSVEVGLISALVSLCVAWATWHLVERPALALPIGEGRRWVLAGLGGAVVLAFAGLGWSHAAAVQQPAGTAAPHPLLRTIAMPALYQRRDCDEWFRADRVVPCTLVDPPGEHRPTVMLVGDSVAAQWSPALEDVARRGQWHLVVLTKSSCPMVDHPFIYQRINRRFVECERWRDGVIAYLRQHPADLLILGSTADYPFSPQEWETGTRSLLTRLHGMAGRTLILAPTPLLPFDGPRCATSRVGQWTDAERQSRCSVDLDSVRDRVIVQRLQVAARGARGVRVLDLSDAVCPGGRCRAEDGGALIYRDGQHLNATYVRRLVPELALQPEFQALGR